ncbi:MAG: hypothetical protein JWR69_1801 [Pedosphaera sp.]|nr:hypothetical protein [Pedosphaera sp.]
MKQVLPLFAAVCCLTLHSSAAVLPAEKLLPDDTLVLLSVPDFTKAREISSNSPQGQLWRDPSLQAFKDKFVNKLKETYVTPLERDLGIHFDDYTGLPQGQFTLAIIGKGTKTEDPGMLLLVDTKDKSEQLKTNLLDLKKKWVDAGKKVRTEKIRDVEFSIITLSSNDLPKTLKKEAAKASSPELPDPLISPDPKESVKKEVYIGQAESLLVMGNSAKSIEKVLARMSGADVKTVSDVPDYEANHAALFRDAVAFGWANAKTFVDMASHMDDDVSETDAASNPFSFKAEKVVAALGLNALKSIALSYRFTPEGAQGTLFFSVPEANRSGLFKILAGEPKESTPPAFVPSDAIKFQRWRIDGQKTWATLQKMLSDINPQAINGINFLLTTAESAAKDKDPNFDIKKNLFGNLGDDMISYSKAPKGDSLADLNSPPSLFLLASPNPEQLSAGLKSVFALMGQQGGAPTEREFLGKKIYTIPLPATGAKGSKSSSLSYACSGGYIAISADNGMLEEYLRSSQAEVKPLKDTPGLGEATQKVAGNGTSIFGYSNDSETMRVTLEALKKDFGSPGGGSLGPLAATMGLGSASKIKEWFDVSLLPDFDKIAKYFSFTVYSGTASADGLSFKSFTPVPAQLKK